MIQSINPAACTGCGSCTKTCPLDVFRLDTMQERMSPCMAACPAGVDIRGTHYRIQQGDLDGAARLYMQAQPFPAITGRVCFHPCESSCARAAVDAPVNINGVEQVLGDWAAEMPAEEAKRRHITKVAIVGSGPAGLSCAWFLAQLGYPVTVFEAAPFPGGMLRYGIPAYRLPDAVVAAQVARLEALGVVFRCNTRVGRDGDISLKELKRRGFEAVMLAPGTSAGRRITLEGCEAEGVHWGLEFLRACRGDVPPRISGDVVVIGGGDVAVDAAITARRLGAKSVHMACLESRDTMPAYPHNQADAEQEGIVFHCGYGPSRLLTQDGRVTGIELQACTALHDAEGRFAPSFDASQTLRLNAAHVIFAIGQVAELDGFAEDVTVEHGRIVVEKVTCATSQWGVFAAGDAATGPASVVAAIAGGRECAFSIHRMLKGADIHGERDRTRPVVPQESLPGKDIQTEPRHERCRLPEDPHAPFAERMQALDREACFAETLRCMTCGSKARIAYTDDCMTCFSCELHCPSGAIFVHPFKERFARTLDQVEVLGDAGNAQA